MKYSLALALFSLSAVAWAQSGDDKTQLDEIEVTGSRIKTTDLQGQAPVFTLDRKALDRSGLGSIGEILQTLSSSGKALNTKFNSSGNFGFPADGGGIGAGSTQIDLRHLEPKRALVLVDGVRWVNESSASGVGGAVDLNTIPLSIVERIEILEDGASAIYGSDAIAGVINIITRKEFGGRQLNGYFGMYDVGDGQTGQLDFTMGGSSLRSNTLLSVGYYNQEMVSSADRGISLEPKPGTGVTRGSSGIPQGRVIFCDPNVTPACAPEDYLDLVLDTGTGTPVYDPTSPNAPPSTYHDFTNADRFNFAPFNLLLTPNERANIFVSHNMQLTDDVRLYAKALYNRRESLNRAAPEPIFIGGDAGTGGLADTISIPANQPFNPFGIDLIAGENFSLLGRRPLEGGPRLFSQEVDTFYVGTGLQGMFDLAQRSFSWDANVAYSDNRAQQSFQNGYNVRRIQEALGDPAACAALPGCVPLNIFGGQGADGRGTITQEMLNYIRINTQDKSDNQLALFSANITSDLFELPAGMLAFASGYEFRQYEGSFSPDAVRVARESQDSPAIPTAGRYNVHEIYSEFSIPVLADKFLAHSLDLSAALRYSRYSTFGGQTTGKAGVKWRPVENLVLRGTYAQGFRAPFIGELFGLAQFGADITDPCSNSDGTDREANCRALGVPAGFEQSNPQITTNTGGNPNLKPEKSDSFTAGFVYSPSWAEDWSWVSRLDFEATYYSHEIDDAIRAPDAQKRLDDCVASGDPNSAFCAGITRTPNGQINRFDNLLANNGSFKTDGVDLKINWGSPDYSIGRFAAGLQGTFVNKYRVTDALGQEFPQKEGVEVNDGAIPRVQANLQVDWFYDIWSASWTVRYIGKVTESCTDGSDGSPNSLTNLGLCSEPDFADNGNSRNELSETFYNDVQFSWNAPFGSQGVKLTAGINNVFDQAPPTCVSCSLNGYDAGTYDLPGQFGYLQADWKF